MASGSVKIATWNVNSIRARQDRLLSWLERHRPDVLCLQELKVQDDAFPFDALQAAGYHAAAHGQKTYNGVAILSRGPLEDVERGLGDDVDDPQARLIAATTFGVRVLSIYVPNGSEVGSEKYAYKLAWLGRLERHLARRYATTDALALCGDFNVAPDDLDVARPEAWAGSVLCHGEARAALERVRSFGLFDAFRRHHPEGHVYTWWDYRMLAFPKNDGLRIDHVFVTDRVLARSTAASVDRDERKGKQPSDHAPVTIEVAAGA